MRNKRLRIALAMLLLSALMAGCAGPTTPPANVGENTNAGLGNAGVTPTPMASPAEGKDVVTLLGVRSKVLVGNPFEVTWQVRPAGEETTVTQTYIHYDFVSHPGDFGTAITSTDAGYQELTTDFAKTSEKLPQTFTLKVPATRTGNMYLRARAVVGGKNYWTAEYTVEVVSDPKALGGGSQEPQPDPSKNPEAFGVAFSLTVKNWEFSPAVLRVKKGNTVKIAITNTEGTHGFALPDFGIDQKLEPGESVMVRFVADKSGEFTFFCNVPCGSGHAGMKGKLIVEP